MVAEWWQNGGRSAVGARQQDGVDAEEEDGQEGAEEEGDDGDDAENDAENEAADTQWCRHHIGSTRKQVDGSTKEPECRDQGWHKCA